LLHFFLKKLMSLKTLSFLTFACVGLAFAGCESQRYKPADWRAANNSTLADRGASVDVATVTKDKKNLERPESPTNWMALSGTGGEAAAKRTSNGTLPARSGTSLPRRQGTSLPQRGYGSGTSLPNRQNRYNTSAEGTTIPQRGRYQSGSTLPARTSGSTLPRR